MPASCFYFLWVFACTCIFPLDFPRQGLKITNLSYAVLTSKLSLSFVVVRPLKKVMKDDDDDDDDVIPRYRLLILRSSFGSSFKLINLDTLERRCPPSCTSRARRSPGRSPVMVMVMWDGMGPLPQ